MELPKSTKKVIPPIPMGWYGARCDMLVDMGMQEVEYNGEKKVQRKVYLRMATPDQECEYTQDGETVTGSRVFGRSLTFSSSDKSTLVKFLKSWKGWKPGDGNDLLELVSEPAQIQLSVYEGSDGIERNSLDAISPPMDPDSIGTPTTTPVAWAPEIGPGEAWDALPDWIKDACRKGHGFEGDPDVPF